MSESNEEKPKRSRPSALLSAYEAHLRALKRFVSRLVKNQSDVEDIVQEAFLLAYNAERGKDIAQPKSYLFRTAKHVSLNHLRQATRRPTEFLEDSAESSEALISDFTLEDEVMAQQKLGIHCEAVATLPEKCRKVYLMRKVYAMSHKEIADTLGITVSTVETHIEKGFARCTEYVRHRMGDGAVRREQPVRKRGA
ncbi:sigma-70 family RNA polymerase sigma factor [Pseudomaricurvus alkylphenolicus]|jgi:RNA polymerase sigma-70 factor (ECF subfamily)|uniref:RNA polymerase sigma factor n=1 Tax=Pseudomaricurvus alkylphenolicus TaxID=1306991 RepID=UPI00141E5D72|nr:sigma-70 family RNA polymerase sigma factor [Pseudomaricurvus alkylphenolicus]NIB42508.1 sigma-70 family RNA polymerase sigma factor [Pseudomaricurvus alkylphenolicus]